MPRKPTKMKPMPGHSMKHEKGESARHERAEGKHKGKGKKRRGK